MGKNITLSETLAQSRKAISEAINQLNLLHLDNMEMRRVKIAENPEYVDSREYTMSMSADINMRQYMKQMHEMYKTLGDIWKAL